MNDDDARANEEIELRRESERIAQLIEDLGAMAGAPVRQRAEELVSRLVHLYGEGLRRLMQILGPTGADGPGQGRLEDRLEDRREDRLRARLRADALVSSLLVLHDLHPDPQAAAEWDPGPEPSPPPAYASPNASLPAASGLVQIDLGRGGGARLVGKKSGEG